MSSKNRKSLKYHRKNRRLHSLTNQFFENRSSLLCYSFQANQGLCFTAKLLAISWQNQQDAGQPYFTGIFINKP